MKTGKSNLRSFLAAGGIICAAVWPWSHAHADQTARERLQAAIAGTGELSAKAQEWKDAWQMAPDLIEERKDLTARRFATNADAAQYTLQRPWFNQYLLLGSRAERDHPAALAKMNWPQPGDAPALRLLLSDADPAIRGLAAEALATLRDPADVPLIAKLLTDNAESAPALGTNHEATATLQDFGSDSPEALDIYRSWQPRRVSAYAKAALWLMTGQDFQRKDFAAWWKQNQGSTDRLWYWQQRILLDMKLATAVDMPDFRATPDAWNKFRADRKQKIEAVRQSVAKELEKVPAEVEAKVRLFAPAFNFEDNTPAMAVRFDCPRIAPERLLELLDHKNLWDDVDWDHGGYDLLAHEVMCNAQKFFTRKNVERLLAIRDREKKNLGWDGQAAFAIGISRLLPPAQPGKLDDPDTEDGVLRGAIRTGKPDAIGADFTIDTAFRAAVAGELINACLPRNSDFLVEQFFAEDRTGYWADTRSGILHGLFDPPLTAEKRAFLAGLLLDKRFEPLWTETRMNADIHRRNAMNAVNVYAGNDAISIDLYQRLGDRASAAEALPEVQKIVRRVLVEQPRKLD